eukprot:COSAG02_NODE_10169_length_2003_cov_2.160714_1_plen_189_part_00
MDRNLQLAIDSVAKHLGERYTTKVGRKGRETYLFGALAIAHWLLSEIDKNRPRNDDDVATPDIKLLADGDGWISKLQPGRYFIDIGADHLQVTVGTNQVAVAKVLRVQDTAAGRLVRLSPQCVPSQLPERIDAHGFQMSVSSESWISCAPAGRHAHTEYLLWQRSGTLRSQRAGEGEGVLECAGLQVI